MGQTHEEITQNLAERLCWDGARHDDCRGARRLVLTATGQWGVSLDEGTVPDDCCHFLQPIGVMGLLDKAHGAAIHRGMVPFVQDCPALRRADAVWDGAQQCPAQLAVQ